MVKSKSKFVPLFDMVLVENAKEPEKTKGGIYLPEKSRDKPDEGIVLAVGPNVGAVKVGDRIVFGKYVGVYLTLEGMEGNLLLHETDILGILS